MRRSPLHRRGRTRSPYTFTQRLQVPARTRARAETRQPLNRETSSSVPVPMATSRIAPPVRTLFLSQKRSHLLKTYSHIGKLCLDWGGGGGGGRRRYGPWPMFPFQAWNSHILPHRGWCWGRGGGGDAMAAHTPIGWEFSQQNAVKRKRDSSFYGSKQVFSIHMLLVCGNV